MKRKLARKVLEGIKSFVNIIYDTSELENLSVLDSLEEMKRFFSLIRQPWYLTIYNKCDDCDLDNYGEVVFGAYCITVTKYYLTKNITTASLRGTYITLMMDYSRMLDVFTEEHGQELILEEIKKMTLSIYEEIFL